ncbi:MAG: DUF177 domain-containing protein [Flavobacteriaceae bacterium]|nr:DUF177 domain-containing protein [Flavobacteriaceae bacterium]
MKDLKAYTIKFVGLKLGLHNFEFKIDNTFFEHFEYNEFNNADVTVNVTMQKKTTLLEFHFEASGAVNVYCDLTNEPFDQTISNAFDLVVKFGEEYNNENEDILIVPHGEYQINIGQYIYELLVLGVPSKRIHPGVEDGSLDSDILKKLEELSPKGDIEKDDNEDIDPRWNTLKKLLTDK